MPEKIHGFEIRDPFDGENEYFKKNPHVAGMAAEDGKIVLNPYSPNKPEEQKAVARNEAIRLWLKKENVTPKFNVTPEQLVRFQGTEYAKPENELALKHTIIARSLTGDPSAGNLTEMQKKWADWVSKKLPK